MRLTHAQALVVLLVLAGATALASVPATAHALLERSDPPAYRLLLKPPNEIVLSFSEPVDPQRTEIRVLDQEGRRIDRQAFRFSSNRRQARLPVRLPGAGIYTVTWRTLSTVDQHTYEGFFTFTLGPLRLGSFALRGGVPAGPAPWEVAARWLMFLGAAVLGGGLVIHRFLLPPVLSQQQANGVRFQELHGRWRVAAGMGAAIFLIGAAGEVVSQAAVAAKDAGESLGTALAQLTSGDAARTSLLLKLAAPMGLLMLLWRRTLGAPLRPVTGLTAAPLLSSAAASAEVSLAALLLAGISLTSHAAATGAVLPVVVDWLHLLSAATWVGGLIYLGAILAPMLRRMEAEDRSRLLGPLVQRFSNLALASVSILVATGLYAAWINIPTLKAATTTAYGRTLIVKIALLLPLLTIAAVNLLVMRPRLATAARQVLAVAGALALQWRFVRLVRAEAVLAAFVLLAAATLALLPTSRQVQALAPERALMLMNRAEGLEGLLRIDPYQVGENTFEFRLRNRRSGLLISDARVRFTFVPLRGDLGTAVAETQPQGDGRFTLKGAYIGTRGPWLIAVTVRLRGKEDVKLLYPVEPDWERGTAITPPTDPQALAMLERADERMNRLRSLRQRQEIADRSGNAVVTFFELAAPNAMRYRVIGGAKAIIIGETHFFNSGGPWERSQAIEPFKFPNFTYAKNASHVVFGPREVVDGVETQAVVFILTLGSAKARYAVWIEGKSHTIIREAMVARSHYMTTRYYDFDAPLKIQVPPSR